MKRFLAITFLVIFTFSLTACSNEQKKEESSKKASASSVNDNNKNKTEPKTTEKTKLMVTSDAIVNGKIADEYGKRGTQIKNKVPTRSIPITISSAPAGTVCYAITMTDPDSKPVCGYEWLHWLATNIETKEISANASIDLKDSIIQGKNSFGTIGYGGPTPPDKAHEYVITVYALNEKLQLKSGYSLDDFKVASDGHVLDSFTFTGSYDK